MFDNWAHRLKQGWHAMCAGVFFYFLRYLLCLSSIRDSLSESPFILTFVFASDLDKRLASGALWDDLETAATSSESVASVNVDLSQLPLTTNEKGEKVNVTHLTKSCTLLYTIFPTDVLYQKLNKCLYLLKIKREIKIG